MPGPLLVVDTPSLLYRAFFALPSSIRGAEGRPVNALLGTANLVLFAVEQYQPRAVALCFGAEAATYRTALYPAYHADRPPMPDELREQWYDAPAFFTAFGWTTHNGGELEADDVLGAFARVEGATGGKTLIYTGDRDMFQCATAGTAILYPRAGNDGPEHIDPDGIRERYGVEPNQVPDFIALRGDPSDGLPGAKGIGEKTARDLLREYGTLEALLAQAHQPATTLKPRVVASLTSQADELRAFKTIATLQPVDVTRPRDAPLDAPQAAAAARARGINRLATRLEALIPS